VVALNTEKVVAFGKTSVRLAMKKVASEGGMRRVGSAVAIAPPIVASAFPVVSSITVPPIRLCRSVASLATLLDDHAPGEHAAKPILRSPSAPLLNPTRRGSPISPTSAGRLDSMRGMASAAAGALPPLPPLVVAAPAGYPRFNAGRCFGHRGLPTSAPENTLSALRAAAAHGLRWVEFDVQLSADGEPVVMHDDTLDRTTSGAGPVSAQPLAALRALDAGAWFDEADAKGEAAHTFAGELVPTLAEFVEECGRLGLAMNVELKGDGTEAEQVAVAQRTHEVLLRCGCVPAPMLQGGGGGGGGGGGAGQDEEDEDEDEGMFIEDDDEDDDDDVGGIGVGVGGGGGGVGVPVLYSSFSTLALRSAGHEFPKALLLWTPDELALPAPPSSPGGAEAYYETVLQRLRACGCVAVHCDKNHPLVKPAPGGLGAPPATVPPPVPFARRMHEAGYPVHCYTVNDLAVATDLIANHGVDAVFSDYSLRIAV